MMNLLSLALLCLLSSTAGALQCQTCSNADCSTTTLTTCTSETMCITATAAVTQLSGTSTSTSNQIYKACAASDLCKSTGNQTYVIDESVADVVVNTWCCDTDGCNSDTLTAPTANSTENGKECHFCYRTTCDLILKCKGNEDRCFEGSLTNGLSVGGCITQNVGDLAAGLWSTPFVKAIANVTDVPTCCNGMLCNLAVPTVASNATIGAGIATTPASGSGIATTNSSAPGEVTMHSHFTRLTMTQVILGLFTLILW